MFSFYLRSFLQSCVMGVMGRFFLTIVLFSIICTLWNVSMYFNLVSMWLGFSYMHEYTVKFQ